MNPGNWLRGTYTGDPNAPDEVYNDALGEGANDLVTSGALGNAHSVLNALGPPGMATSAALAGIEGDEGHAFAMQNTDPVVKQISPWLGTIVNVAGGLEGGGEGDAGEPQLRGGPSPEGAGSPPPPLSESVPPDDIYRDPGVDNWYAVPNANGQPVWVNPGHFNQNDMAPIVGIELQNGNPVDILSGAHGDPSGVTTPDYGLFEEDNWHWGDNPDITVHNFPELTPAQLEGIINGHNPVVVGICFGDIIPAIQAPLLGR